MAAWLHWGWVTGRGAHNLIDLIDEDNALLLYEVEGLPLDVVLVEELLGLHLGEDGDAVAHHHLALLRLPAPARHHLVESQDDLVHRELVAAVEAVAAAAARRLLLGDLDLDQAVVAVAHAQQLAEGLAVVLDVRRAHQTIEQLLLHLRRHLLLDVLERLGLRGREAKGEVRGEGGEAEGGSAGRTDDRTVGRSVGRSVGRGRSCGGPGLVTLAMVIPQSIRSLMI